MHIQAYSGVGATSKMVIHVFANFNEIRLCLVK